MRFINEEMDSEIEGNMLQYTSKHVSLFVLLNKDAALVSVYSTQSTRGNPGFLCNLELNEKLYFDFCKEYNRGRTISNEFEKELQKLIDNNIELILKRLDKFYLNPIEDYQEKLDGVKEVYNKFREEYSKEFLLI